VSHLPHLLAYALVSDVSKRPNAAQLFGYAAGGFRDFTRIASSHPESGRDISVANRDLLLLELNSYAKNLKAIEAWLEECGCSGAGKAVCRGARGRRAKWLSNSFA